MLTFTLENKNNDIIRKDDGKWGFHKEGKRTEFQTIDEASTAIDEMNNQGLDTATVEIAASY